MRLLWILSLLLAPFAISQPEMPDDLFDSPSAKELASEATAEATKLEKEKAERLANETDEEKRVRLEKERRKERLAAEDAEAAITKMLSNQFRRENKSLQRSKDDRLNLLSSMLVVQKTTRFGSSAPQETQLNTEVIVNQNTIIIYQNERIIELLEGLKR
jgi:hypothetical protein